MRIGIDATCWSNNRGYGRFTRGIVQSLLKVDTDNEYILFVDDKTYAQNNFPKDANSVVVSTKESPTEAAKASGRRSLRDLWAMTMAVADHPLDALFIPSVYTYFPVLNRTKIILGIHDAIPEDYPELIFPEKQSRRLWNVKSWLARKQAKYILTVSDYAKKRILHHFKQPPEKIWVVDEAPDPIFRSLSPSEIDWEILGCHNILPTDRFVLYLGGINPHKNLGMLVESLAKLVGDSHDDNLKLVIIGDIKADVFTPGLAQLKAKITQCNMENRVTFTGFISDSEVLHFLNASQVVVLCSLAEGFGLPALESAICGTPVIATNNSPLPEVLARGGIFIDPTQPHQLTQALKRVLSNEQERLNLGKIALEKAQQYSWDHSANQMKNMLATL